MRAIFTCLQISPNTAAGRVAKGGSPGCMAVSRVPTTVSLTTHLTKPPHKAGLFTHDRFRAGAREIAGRDIDRPIPGDRIGEDAAEAGVKRDDAGHAEGGPLSVPVSLVPAWSVTVRFCPTCVTATGMGGCGPRGTPGQSVEVNVTRTE